METFWFAIKFGFGLAVAFGIVFILLRQVMGFLHGLRFTSAGCSYQRGEKPGTPSGWLIRDPRDVCLGGGDWMLWDEARNVCLGLVDYDCIPHDV